MEKEVTDLDLDALEATARAATPGPWVACDPQPFLPGAQIRLYGPGWSPIRIEDSSGRYVRPTADAQYIAAANPTTTLALIARIREVEATIDAVEALLDTPTDERGITWWAWIEDGLGGTLYSDLRGILTRHQDKLENGSER